MTPSRIAVIGYRGTGKTTSGAIVAAALGWPFVDVDDVVEATAGMTIAEIFATAGEADFRDRESAALAALLNGPARVIATGGGAILRSANRDLLRTNALVVWLAASPAVVWKRITADPTTRTRRPNLTPAGGFAEVANLIAARESLYRETAHAIIPADAASPDEVAAAILTAWDTRLGSRAS